MFDDLTEKDGAFETHAECFLMAMAIGILMGERSTRRIKTSTFHLDSYNAHDPTYSFPILLKAQNPRLNKEELARDMEAFADTGVHVLHKEWSSTTTIDFKHIWKNWG